MTERRTLTQGLKATPTPLDPAKEHEFVFGKQATPTTAPAQSNSAPMSTRLRADFVTAMKRASLQRQLEGVEPNTLKDILEEAIEPWLRTHGYLS